jgi:hypothetical protein
VAKVTAEGHFVDNDEKAGEAPAWWLNCPIVQLPLRSTVLPVDTKPEDVAKVLP